MDLTLLTIILVASLVLAPLVLLVISGQLIRSRMHLPAPTGGGKRDLQRLEDALVEFFARSKASSCILAVLAARGKPVGFNALVEEIRTEQERRRDGEYLPMSALRAVLTTLQVVRLVRMDRKGFSITDLGREVYRRIISQLNPRTPSAHVSPNTVRQHGRRDYGIATSRAPSRTLGRVSATCRGARPAFAVNLLHR